MCVCGDNLSALLDKACGLEVVDMCVCHPLIQQAQSVFPLENVRMIEQIHPSREDGCDADTDRKTLIYTVPHDIT